MSARQRILLLMAICLITNAAMLITMTASNAHWLTTGLAEHIIFGLIALDIILVLALIGNLILLLKRHHH